MAEYIHFDTQEELNNILINAPAGVILVNDTLLNNRVFPDRVSIGFDFDGTISTFENGQLTSWQEVRRESRKIVSADGVDRMGQDYKTWGRDTTIEGQIAWADSTYKIYHDEGVTQNQLITVGQTLRIRLGFAEVAEQIVRRNGGLAVVTYGMSAVVEPGLNLTGLSVSPANGKTKIESDITLYAEQTEFDENGLISLRGVKPNTPRVLGANKHEYMDLFARLQSVPPEGVVFLGDAMHDLRAKGDGRGILIHHRENNSYTPSIEDVFNNCEYVLVGHSLVPLTDLINNFWR